MSLSLSIRNFAVPLSIRLLFAVPGAFSQVAPHTIAEVNVPFAFQYSGKTLPAGRYQIRTFQGSFMVMEGDKETAVGQVRRDDPLRAVEPAKLIFRTNGTDVVLKDIWVPGLEMHMVCPPAGKAHGQELARGAAAPSSTVTVALMESPR